MDEGLAAQLGAGASQHRATQAAQSGGRFQRAVREFMDVAHAAIG